MKRERNLEKWPYDIIRQSDVIYSTTQHYTQMNLATYDNNQLLYNQPTVNRRDVDCNRPRQQKGVWPTRLGQEGGL